MVSRRIQSHVRQTVVARDTAIRNELAQVTRATGKLGVTQHKLTVNDWNPEHRPDFVSKETITPDLLRFEISPRGRNKRIWLWVDKGTEPHKIRAKPGERLLFQTGYSPRTQVGRAHAGSGQASGPFAQVEEVDHPGTAARGLSKAIGKKLSPAYRRQIENILRRK